MDKIAEARDLNELFWERLSTSDGVKEAQEKLTGIIKQRVWEDGFARKILPREQISRDTPGVQEDLKTDTIYYLVHTETLGHAVSVTIRGNGDSQLWYGKKFPIGLFKISTMRHHTDAYTIKAMTIPVNKMIEQQFAYLIQMIEDLYFLRHVESAVWRVQIWDDPATATAGLSSDKIMDGTVKEISVCKGEIARTMTDFGNNPYLVTLINKSDIPYLARLFPGTQGESMEGQTILFNRYDFHGINTWHATEVGNEAATQLTFGQFKIPTLAGYKWMVTNKTSILRPGCIYMFSEPDFLGKFIVFMTEQLYIEKYGPEFETWYEEVIGMGFGNLRGVKKLELFPGSATPGAESDATKVVHVRPLTERQIVKENVQVDHTDVQGRPDGYIPPLF